MSSFPYRQVFKLTHYQDYQDLLTQKKITMTKAKYTTTLSIDTVR